MDSGTWGQLRPFRLIDWGVDGFVTIETCVSHLPEHEREALLETLNAQGKEYAVKALQLALAKARGEQPNDAI
jgi:hypothetical protein